MRVDARPGDKPESGMVTRQVNIPRKRSNTRTKLAKLSISHTLNEQESVVEKLHILNRLDIHAVAHELTITPSHVLRIISRIRVKYAKQGELMLAQPDAAHAHETRTRYDSIIAKLRADFERVPEDMFGVRVKMARTIADIERMRDDALHAFGMGSSTAGTQVGAVVYVSHLRAKGGGEHPPTHSERLKQARDVTEQPEREQADARKEPRSPSIPDSGARKIIPPSPTPNGSNDT